MNKSFYEINWISQIGDFNLKKLSLWIELVRHHVDLFLVILHHILGLLLALLYALKIGFICLAHILVVRHRQMILFPIVLLYQIRICLLLGYRYHILFYLENLEIYFDLRDIWFLAIYNTLFSCSFRSLIGCVLFL